MLRYSQIARTVGIRRASAAAAAVVPMLHSCGHSQKNVLSMSMMMTNTTTTTTTIITTATRHASASGFDKLHPLHETLNKLINKHRIVVFLTGTPSQPQCGFTMRMVDMLEQLPIEYDFVDIMESDEICEGLKSYSNWPTYPQMYIDGELIGGYDITRQMVLDGSLIKLLQEKKLVK